MKMRVIKKDIHWIGAVDWDRRLFDSLIPLPDGTSYNAYVVKGSEKTVLLDTVDPSMSGILMSQLEGIDSIDYLISHHAEQDHSGTIPCVLEKYKSAKVITTPKGKGMLMDLLCIPDRKFITVDDGEILSLGNKTLQFLYAPWVHWPETMVTYLREDNILFSCDLFGSHLATTDLYVTDEARVYESAKRYYAEIMMPFRMVIRKNMEKIMKHKIDLIAPSHGPIYSNPAFIVDAYRDWISDYSRNVVVLPYISMHQSTKKMVEYLVSALTEKGITVYQFDLTVTDIGKLAKSLVDAATMVIGTPTVHVGPHPKVFCAAYLANILRPKLKFASIIASYGWGSRAIEQTLALISNLKVEVFEPVLSRGLPKEAEFKALDGLATTISEKHKEHNFIQ
jgi:flavorubredoxin